MPFSTNIWSLWILHSAFSEHWNLLKDYSVVEEMLSKAGARLLNKQMNMNHGSRGLNRFNCQRPVKFLLLAKNRRILKDLVKLTLLL